MNDGPAADTSTPPPEVVHAPMSPARRVSRHRRGRSAAGMVLQVVLIAVGVFLGLAGEQWREDRENRPETRSSMAIEFDSIQAPRFDSTAWQLAVASGTIAHIDQELASVLARTYGYQAMTDQLGAVMMQVLYERRRKSMGKRFCLPRSCTTAT